MSIFFVLICLLYSHLSPALKSPRNTVYEDRRQVDRKDLRRDLSLAFSLSPSALRRLGVGSDINFLIIYSRINITLMQRRRRIDASAKRLHLSRGSVCVCGRV
uniref:Putative secreted protein n=1 Tax=Anopheles darlingi TaxID=43151 RepID=A0A2M4DFJ0_ANODA